MRIDAGKTHGVDAFQCGGISLHQNSIIDLRARRGAPQYERAAIGSPPDLLSCVAYFLTLILTVATLLRPLLFDA